MKIEKNVVIKFMINSHKTAYLLIQPLKRDIYANISGP